MNNMRLRYLFLYVQMAVFFFPAVTNVTRTFGVQPEGYPQSRVMCAYQNDYLLGGSLVIKNGTIDKVLFDGGYAKATRLSNTTYGFTPYYYNRDHLGNNRDYATINELICLSNMENVNAVLINDGVSQSERLLKLNKIVIQQMAILNGNNYGLLLK